MCEECDKRDGTNHWTKSKVEDNVDSPDEGDNPTTDVVELTDEQQAEKDTAELTVNPESNATYTKMSPAPQAPQPGDVIAT